MILKKKDFFINIIACIFIINLFIQKNILTETVVYATTIFLKKVFPSLFIMIIIENILINHNFIYLLYKIIPIKKINPKTFFIMITSIIGGTPNNVILLKDLLEKNNISEEDANYFLECNFFSNPLFLFSILSLIFHNQSIVLKIIGIHYLSNFIILCKNEKLLNNMSINYNTTQSFTKSISEGIKKSIETNLMVLGTIVFFLLTTSFTLSFIQSPILKVFLNGIFEITQGLNSLITLNIYIKIKEIIALILISFGGLSIHMQVYSIIDDSNLKYKCFLIGRIKSILISIILYLIAALI